MRKYSGLLLITLTLFSTALTTRVGSHPAIQTNIVDSVPVDYRVLMTYFAGWMELAPADIPGDKITHVLYAFSDLNAKGQCAVIDETAAKHMAAFKSLKGKYPKLKVLISVGGWTNSNNFSANVKTDAQRSALVQSCINLWIKGDGLSGPGVIDGIDIDWEYPGSEGNTKDFAPEDKQHYLSLMQEFRKQLDVLGKADNKYYTLSAAIPPDADKLSAGYDLAALAKILDYFNQMDYDFHGSWEEQGPTNFHSNLLSDTEHPSDYSVEAGIKAFEDGGVPANKIVLGLPYYGTGWTGVEAKGNGLYQPATGVIAGDTLPYSLIKTKYETDQSYSKYRTSAHAPWLYSADAKTFIAYDDPEAVGEKASYALKNGLAGIMTWELSQDDPAFTLTSTLCTKLELSSAGHTC